MTDRRGGEASLLESLASIERQLADVLVDPGWRTAPIVLVAPCVALHRALRILKQAL